MNDEQLLRYARHLMLDDIGIEGQRRLLAAHALVVGAGGLGSPVAMYLGSAGVGRLTVIDDDTVDLTNLQRQIAHNLSRVGQPKAESVRATVAAINPDVQFRALVRRADAPVLDELLPGVDVVLDCCDNFATRHAVNAACVRHGKPLVSGAAIGWDAQIAVYDTRNDQSPCYACLFPPDAGHEDVSCNTMGVFAPLVGIVGSVQAAEALKLIIGGGEPLTGRLLMLDARSMHWDSIATARQPHCSVCAGRTALSSPP
jgi:molybdopterin/thiamine biosynthesis adenylyltransferase